MAIKYFHFDRFEIFGEAYHRAIVLPSDEVLTNFKLKLASFGVKADGKFYKKLMQTVLAKPEFKHIEIFDIDAEPDACIISHSSLAELQSITNTVDSILQENEITEEFAKEVRDYFEPIEDDSLD